MVNAAITCLELGGPEALSMRAVARLLETGASSLYAHVANQNELYDLVLDRVAASVPPVPSQLIGSDAVEALLSGYGQALSRYPGTASIALHSLPTGDASLDLFERLLQALDSVGVTPELGFRAADSLMLLVTASVAEQDARRRHATDGYPGTLYANVLASSAVRRPLMEKLFVGERGPRAWDSIGQAGVAWAVRVFLAGLTR